MITRRAILIAVAGAAFLCVALLAASSLQGSHTDTEAAQLPVAAATVTLTPQGYEPERLTVRVGGTVTFVSEIGTPHWPASNLHPQHTIYPEFDPARPLASGEAWSFTFDRPGVWKYHDHLRSYYVGTITVVE